MTPFFIAFILARQTVAPFDVVANVRSALATNSKAAVWPETVLTGTANFRGVPSNYSLRFQQSGTFCQTIDGKLGQTVGFDGQGYWEIDFTGATRRLDFVDVDRVQALLAVLTDSWLDANAPIKTWIGKPDPSKNSYAVHVTFLNSGFKEVINVDGDTWIPTTAQFEIASVKTTIAVSDWRPAGASKLPCVVKITEDGLTDSLKVDELQLDKIPPAEAFSMPKSTPTDLSYDGSLPALVETKRTVTGHVLVHPRINGQDIGWFILDSGAESMIIDAASANTLTLPKIGKESVEGIGGSVQEPFRTAAEFTLGPATMRNVTFLEIDLHGLSKVFKVPLAGIVGFDFFRRFIVQLDLKVPSVEIDNVTDFHLPSGEWSKIQFSSGNPAVQATFEGDHTAWFRLDTGANGSVTFHSPTVQSLHLLDGRQTTAGGMEGVGGVAEARIGELEWFELGGHRFEKLTATFSTAKVGAFADSYLAGNIGQDLMEPFTVVFDFGGSRVAFLPH